MYQANEILTNFSLFSYFFILRILFKVLDIDVSSFSKTPLSPKRLPSMGVVDRKRRILDFALSTRQQFVKILVLIRWGGRNAKDMEICQVS